MALLLRVARPLAPARTDVVHSLSQRHVVNRSRPISRTSHRVQQHRERQLQGTHAYRSSLCRHEAQSLRPASAARMLGRRPANVLQTFWAVAANVLQTSDRRNPAKPGETTHAIPCVFRVSCPCSLSFAEHEPIGEIEHNPCKSAPRGTARGSGQAALRQTSSADVGACVNPGGCARAPCLVEVAVEPAQHSRLDTYLLVGF